MNVINKVSEIKAQDVWDYIQPSEPMDADAQNTIQTMIGVATSYITSYTGLTDLDGNRDFVIVLLILCQDMWDNRTLYVDESNLNHVVQTILGMHSVNLL